MNRKINTNTAIKALMDDPLMIGRHRPIVGQWFQAWVEEFIVSVKASSLEEIDVELLKKEILKQIEPYIVVTTEKISLAEGWRKGTPMQANDPRGVEVTAKFHGFRNSPLQQDDGFNR